MARPKVQRGARLVEAGAAEEAGAAVRVVGLLPEDELDLLRELLIEQKQPRMKLARGQRQRAGGKAKAGASLPSKGHVMLRARRRPRVPTRTLEQRLQPPARLARGFDESRGRRLPPN
jgi:hypothetical protein